MKTLLLALTAFVLLAFTFSSTRFSFHQAQSKIFVDGTSTMHDWTCEIGKVSGSFEANPELADDPAVFGSISKADVNVPVAQIDCNNGTMDGKAKRALNTDKHPNAKFTLSNLQVAGAASQGWTPLRGTGTLTLNGSTQSVSLNVKGQLLANGQVRLQGDSKFAMSRFGVAPPTAMLGAVKTGDEVKVRFDVTAQPMVQN